MVSDHEILKLHEKLHPKRFFRRTWLWWGGGGGMRRTLGITFFSDMVVYARVLFRENWNVQPIL